MLVIVDAPHYYVGLVVIGDKVIRAAPIIKWTVGKKYADVKWYFDRKKFTVIERRLDDDSFDPRSPFYQGDVTETEQASPQAQTKACP